jgi:hypothetical protein
MEPTNTRATLGQARSGCVTRMPKIAPTSSNMTSSKHFVHYGTVCSSCDTAREVLAACFSLAAPLCTVPSSVLSFSVFSHTTSFLLFISFSFPLTPLSFPFPFFQFSFSFIYSLLSSPCLYFYSFILCSSIPSYFAHLCTGSLFASMYSRTLHYRQA